MGDTRRFSGKARAILGLSLCAAIGIMLAALSRPAMACPDPTTLKGSDFSRRFVQTRILAGLSAPLVSEGVITVQGDRVDWHTRTPFDILTSIGPNGISQSIDGATPIPVPAGVGRTISSEIAALMRGDVAALKQTFRLDVAKESDPSGRWTATLQPYDEMMEKTVGTITMVGCDSVEHVTLQRPSGDQDVIEIFPLN